VEIDRYAVALAHELQKSVLEDYDGYEFHPAAAKLQNFCSEELSAFYLDVLKDRLYTCGRDSPARRSAQNALYHVTQSLLRLIAPVLSFTAEEAWRVFQPGDDTVFAHTTYRLPEISGADALLGKWRALRQIRSEVQKLLENHRAAGRIGSSLQAEVEIAASGEKLELLKGLGDDLRFVLITSRATVVRVAGEADEAIRTLPSPHPKCQRCWHWRADVGADPNHPEICGRCVQNLYGSGEPRRFA
jgi:isoleucyl-tRNA synthetase